MKRLLIIGGSGYLGQHLLQSFSELSPHLSTAFTHHSSSPPKSIPDAIIPFQLDLHTGQGFHSITNQFGQPDIVVNCAALSVPRACETDPALAMSVNVPSTLVKWLSSFTECNNTLLIHLSTDQVYEGTKSFYKEDDETLPVNVYGKSKVAAEEYIFDNWSNFVILRSSIIFGRQTISPVSKSLPIQWMDGVLSKGQEAEFFHDEFRCPVYVKDVVNIIRTLTDRWISDGKKSQLVLNVGGPNRLSRAEMAETVARVRGYNTSLVKPVSASSIDRGVKSPADISMDISKLIQTLDFTPTSFEDGVKLTFGTNV
ncbi:putative methionine adenosyltransferase [Helianthus annuus]|nr:putative methionine adenosyltransferase [Helianthus annuus]